MSPLPTLAAPARKRSRWPLYLPFVLMFGGLGACTVAWLVERQAVMRALDAAPAQVAARGLKLSLGDRTISGFPLRLRVEVAAPRVESAGGWAAEAPSVVAQAYVFMPRRWVVVAPDGLTVTRAQGGALAVAVKRSGRAWRGSAARTGGW